MAKAYGWAFSNPLRKVYYNMATVALGVFVASVVGLVEYLQVLANHTHMHGPVWDWLRALDFEVLGYFIVGAFVIAAVLTPPDVLSQLSLALPLMALYEGSIWSVRWVEKKAAADKAKDAASAAAKPAE